MIYNLDERATLYGDGAVASTGTLREMIALALTWDEDRFGTARIETVTQEIYSAASIEEIADEADIGRFGDEGHPS